MDSIPEVISWNIGWKLHTLVVYGLYTAYTKFALKAWQRQCIQKHTNYQAKAMGKPLAYKVTQLSHTLPCIVR